MRRRIGLVWALAGTPGLALLLAILCHPIPRLADVVGMSAPPARTASIESASGIRLLPSHFDWSAPAPRVSAFSPARSIDPVAIDSPASGAAALHYPPLHRRPPPSFS